MSVRIGRASSSLLSVGLLALITLSPARARAAKPSVSVTGIDGAASPARVSLSRSAPRATLPSDDPDAFRVLLTAPEIADLPSTIGLASFAACAGKDRTACPTLDTLRDVPMTTTPCPAGVSGVCATSIPLEAVIDEIDRFHPLRRTRSIVAELRGLITVHLPEAMGESIAELEVLAPRALSRDVLEVPLRVHIVRERRGGAAPFGNTDEEALAIVAAQRAAASRVWASCGVAFTTTTTIVDPPPRHLLSFGCEGPALASGGDVVLRVDGKIVRTTLRAGMPPEEAAHAVALAFRKAGYRVTRLPSALFQNASIRPSDLSIRSSTGALVELEGMFAHDKASNDASLRVCIGEVDLSDGLAHFTDASALVGTVEERTLVKAFDDGDPATIEVFYVPGFSGDGRIGESFIFSDGGAVRNATIVDRGGLRAEKGSFTLAHELGHVLLDQPGHPDDFGTDTPTSLMDSDGVDATAHGPRRLSLSECARAFAQSPRPPSPSPAPKKPK